LFIEPGRSILIPLNLFSSELRRILLTYPQASLDIEFTVYIDPDIAEDGTPTNRLLGVEPVKEVINRPAVKLTNRYLQNRLDSFSNGTQSQKIRIIRLFNGLLMEQHAMANREPLYRFMYEDWMPDLLKSALLRGLADRDWVVKVHTMDGMLSLPLDYDLINGISENLNDVNWPVRLMALFLLAKNQGQNFGKVLNWAARYDQNEIVRDMAIALGGFAPEILRPAEQPNMSNDSEKETPAGEHSGQER
jgi:hypothetical protein